MSTIGASNGNNPYAQVQAQTLWKRGQQSSAAQGDAASQSFAPASAQSTNAPASPQPPAPSTKTSASVGTFPRYEPQTLQTLLALQAAKG